MLKFGSWFIKFVGMLGSFILGVFASLLVARYASEMWTTLKQIYDISPKILFIIAFLTIIVSGIFCMVLVYKIKENIREANKENSNSLQKIEFILEKEKSLGILSIDPRSSYTNDKYKHIFKNTYDELVFSGLTLYNTINKEKYDDLREIFMSTIIRLIKNNKPIKILLLKSTQEEVAKRRREFTEFVEKTCEKLRSEKVTDRQIKERFLIKESEYLPYYIVKNENILHIGHYTFEKFSENSQSKMCIFDVNEECDYGKYYYGDFKKFFEDSAYFTPEYNNIVKAKDE